MHAYRPSIQNAEAEESEVQVSFYYIVNVKQAWDTIFFFFNLILVQASSLTPPSPQVLSGCLETDLV